MEFDLPKINKDNDIFDICWSEGIIKSAYKNDYIIGLQNGYIISL